MLRSLNISTRLGLTLFFLCFFLMLAGGLGVYGTMINHSVTQQVVADQAEIIVVGRINVKVFDSRLHVAQARLNPEAGNLLKEGKVLTENNLETLRDLDELKRIAAGTENSPVVDAFVATVSVFVESYLRPVEQALLAGDAQKMNELVNSVGNKYYSPIKQSRTELMKAIEASTQKKQQEADSIYQLTINLIGVMVGVGLVLAIAFGGAVLRTISRDTSELLTGMLRIEKDHDLTQRLPVHGNDELARIAQAVNQVLESIHNFARSVRDQSGKNIGATSSLLSKVASVSEDAQKQNHVASHASQQLATIVESIHAIARRASETRDLTLSSAQLGRQGADVVNGTALEMAKVAKQVQIAAEDIRNLDQQSAEIDAIVSAISDIADQTNLLALNAAIESARAGESGRGFAVVADEVRKLAERTRHFTGEIQKTITTIRQETASAAKCMESGREIAETGVRTAEAAAQTILEIQSALDSINGAVGDIAQTVASQESSADVVASQINHIVRLCNENAQNAESSRELATQTEDSSKNLAQAASVFRV